MTYIPTSQKIENLVAKEGELIYAKTGLPFSGEYHIVSGKAYAGAKFDFKKPAIPLDKPDLNLATEIQALVNNYLGIVSWAKARAERLKSLKRTTEETLNAAKQVLKKQDEGSSPREGIYYFVQKTNDPNKKIQEFSKSDKNTTNAILFYNNSPKYKVVLIDFSANNIEYQIDEGEKIIPGLKDFLAL